MTLRNANSHRLIIVSNRLPIVLTKTDNQQWRAEPGDGVGDGGDGEHDREQRREEHREHRRHVLDHALLRLHEPRRDDHRARRAARPENLEALERSLAWRTRGATAPSPWC